jgi:hypothetical protein
VWNNKRGERMNEMNRYEIWDKLNKFPKSGETYKLHLSTQITGIDQPCYAEILDVRGKFAVVEILSKEKIEGVDFSDCAYPPQLLNLNYVVMAEAIQ